MIKNKNLILSMGVGLLVTILIWGFVGGCGTSNLKVKSSDTVETAGSTLGQRDDAYEDTKKPGKNIVVENGDSLWGLSKKYDVSISEIKEANNLNSEIITVGQKLIIPGVEEEKSEEVEQKQVTKTVPERKRTSKSKNFERGKKDKAEEIKEIKYVEIKKEVAVKPGFAIYKVREGDSLWRIAQVYGTTIEKIAQINGFSKNKQLKPGQEILVPKNG